MSTQQAEGSDRQKYEFRRLIEDLKQYEGSGTQLVSLYITPDEKISDNVAHINEEYSEASNIKSKQTRTNVQDALKSIKDRLRYYDTFPPENGLVLFSGAIDTGGGQTKMVTRALGNPHQHIISSMSRCYSDCVNAIY